MRININSGVLRVSLVLNLMFLLYISYLVSTSVDVRVYSKEVEEVVQGKFAGNVPQGLGDFQNEFLKGVPLEEDPGGVLEDQELPKEEEEELQEEPVRKREVGIPKGLPPMPWIKRFPCYNLPQRAYYGQRGEFWVLYNYLVGEKRYGCDETITLTTIADFTFLDNLFPLIERWDGPISLAIYTPGSDFDKTLEALIYLRECVEPAIKERVSVHFFFESKHHPARVPQIPIEPGVDYCDLLNEPSFDSDFLTYRKKKGLSFPVNLGRNIARELATTHYIFPSDIELFPSPGFIDKFFEMLSRNESYLSKPNPRVFVLPVFEIHEKVENLPETKDELLELLANETAVTFHKNICQYCHKIPKYEEWVKSPGGNSMAVFHIAKRAFRLKHWEPFFVGTQAEPLFDERLTWEGRRNKMTQGYIMCTLNYDYMVLDNAFLIHRPGIKIMDEKSKANRFYTPEVRKQNVLIDRVVVPELRRLYGQKKGCVA